MTSDTQPGGTSTDEHAIVDLYRALLDNWNRQSARGMADQFAENGSCVGFDGSMMDGREQIASVLAGIFGNHPTATYVAKIREVRMLGSDSGMIRSVVGMVPRGGSDINPAVNAIQSMVAVREGGDWRVALFQNTPAAFHGRPELADALTRDLREVLRASRSDG